jgi:hypothetical protein
MARTFSIVLLVLLVLFVLLVQTNQSNTTKLGADDADFEDSLTFPPQRQRVSKKLLDRINLIARIKEKIASKPHVGALWG